MFSNFKTDAEKEEIARQYIARRKKNKRKAVKPTWFPGPACKVTKQDSNVQKSGPDFSSLNSLKNTEQWKELDSQVAEASTVGWVRDCFKEQTELRIAKVPYLHGVLQQDHTVCKHGANPLMLCDPSGQIEVRLHELLRARYEKQLKAKDSQPAIVMKNVTIFRSDSGEDFYACCSLENFVHLVAAAPETPNVPEGSEPYLPMSPLQYGSQLSEAQTPQMIDLASASTSEQARARAEEEDEEQELMLLPRPGPSDVGEL